MSLPNQKVPFEVQRPRPRGSNRNQDIFYFAWIKPFSFRRQYGRIIIPEIINDAQYVRNKWLRETKLINLKDVIIRATVYIFDM